MIMVMILTVVTLLLSQSQSARRFVRSGGLLRLCHRIADAFDHVRACLSLFTCLLQCDTRFVARRLRRLQNLHAQTLERMFNVVRVAVVSAPRLRESRKDS